jgi:hypothetical protein
MRRYITPCLLTNNINPTRLQRSHGNETSNTHENPTQTKCAKRKFLLKYIIYTSPPLSFSSQSPICSQKSLALNEMPGRKINKMERGKKTSTTTATDDRKKTQFPPSAAISFENIAVQNHVSFPPGTHRLSSEGDQQIRVCEHVDIQKKRERARWIEKKNKSKNKRTTASDRKQSRGRSERYNSLMQKMCLRLLSRGTSQERRRFVCRERGGFRYLGRRRFVRRCVWLDINGG